MKRKTSIATWEELKAITSRWLPGRYVYDQDEYVQVGRYFRCPRTTAEKRFAASEEHKPFVRGRRSIRNLPEVYDDMHRSRLGSKSWKDMYKCSHQWMKGVDLM